MKTLSLVWTELIGLFVDDEFLALAILGVVAVASVAATWFHAAAVAGGILLAGCVVVLLASAYRGARKS